MRIKALIPLLYVTLLLSSPVVAIDRELVREMVREIQRDRDRPRPEPNNNDPREPNRNIPNNDRR